MERSTPSLAILQDLSTQSVRLQSIKYISVHSLTAHLRVFITLFRIVQNRKKYLWIQRGDDQCDKMHALMYITLWLYTMTRFMPKIVRSKCVEVHDKCGMSHSQYCRKATNGESALESWQEGALQFHSSALHMADKFFQVCTLIHFCVIRFGRHRRSFAKCSLCNLIDIGWNSNARKMCASVGGEESFSHP